MEADAMFELAQIRIVSREILPQRMRVRTQGLAATQRRWDRIMCLATWTMLLI